MDIITFSDTHGLHNKIKLPAVDIAIFAGDACTTGWSKQEVINFLDWYSKQMPTHKVMIAGNHDRFFENASKEEIEELLAQYPSITYLNDTSVIIEGIKIHGSPIQPTFFNWAFNRDKDQIQKHWDLIPDDVDILITHGPPYETLDKTANGYSVGCPLLKERIKNLKHLHTHIFGHIHSNIVWTNNGVVEKNKVQYINASCLDDDYKFVNDPILFTINENIMKQRELDILLSSLIGKSRQEGQALCNSAGYQFSLSREDGTVYCITCDLNFSRINIEIDEFKITKAYVG